MKVNTLKGIFPVIPTIFNDNDEINLESQKKVIQFSLESGADGIVFPGMASEYSFLSKEERGILLKLLVDEVNGKVPLIAGIGAPDSNDVIALGKEACSFGITRFMIMAPSHLGNDVTKHKEYFLHISENLPNCEIMLQNAPSPMGAGLDVEFILEIVSSNPSITYIKEETLPSGPRITSLLKNSIPHLIGIFGGGGARYIIDELNRGAIGALPAAEITDLHVALFKSYKNGDYDTARRLYRLSLPLLTAQVIYRTRLTKYVLYKRGIITNMQHVRAPITKLEEQAMKDINNMLEDLIKSKALTWVS
ncbi:dihydrodipicolinate synthase family protein [Maribacter sp. Asnod2-G09]|uniref:dihydrodipicolinate synthase family protein n=1 Tax=Maribacter sp. Asnod2-G09 TaxID=3160577 RepID=UPI00386BF7B8